MLSGIFLFPLGMDGLESHPADMKQQIGFFLQFAALVFLAMVFFYNVNVGFKRLIVLPALTASAAALFYVGYLMRESKK